MLNLKKEIEIFKKSLDYKESKIKKRIFDIDHKKIFYERIKKLKEKIINNLWNEISNIKENSNKNNKKEFGRLLIELDKINIINQNNKTQDVYSNSKEKIKLILDKISKLLPDKKEFNLKINLPNEIKEEINLDYKEMISCYKNKEHRSSTILAGRILEVILHRKYFEVTGKDILTTNPDIGLGKLISKLMEKNVKFDPGLTNQIHLLNNVRIHAVHKKQEIFNPSKEQNKAIILLTIDIIKKMFR